MSIRCDNASGENGKKERITYIEIDLNQRFRVSSCIISLYVEKSAMQQQLATPFSACNFTAKHRLDVLQCVAAAANSLTPPARQTSSLLSSACLQTFASLAGLGEEENCFSCFFCLLACKLLLLLLF